MEYMWEAVGSCSDYKALVVTLKEIQYKPLLYRKAISPEQFDKNAEAATCIIITISGSIDEQVKSIHQTILKVWNDSAPLIPVNVTYKPIWFDQQVYDALGNDQLDNHTVEQLIRQKKIQVYTGLLKDIQSPHVIFKFCKWVYGEQQKFSMVSNLKTADRVVA